MAADGAQSKDGNLLGEAITNLVEGNKVFDRYTLMKIVGRGRASVVWKAWDERLGRDVALKFLPAMGRPDASALATLKSEVKKLQEIKHPQIVSIDNVEHEGPVVAIVSDFVDGQTLSQLREQKSDQVFSPAELSDWLQHVCAVLDHGHREGMTPHGALKPGNILVDQRGVVRVTDYGLERCLNEFVARTTDIKDAGRDLLYLSPQVASGEPVNVLDDIYALGATLYELLTSKPPFYTGDIMLQLQQKVPPPMTHRRKELRVIGEPIPRIWEETIAACLAKDPAQRPQSIERVVEMLELKSAAAAPPVEVAPVAPPSANKPIAIGIVVMVLLIAAVAGALLAKKKKPVEVSNAGGTNQPGLSDAALKEIEAKRLQAEENARKAEAEAKRLADEAKRQLEAARKEAERVKQEEAKRLADAKKAEQEAAAKIKAAEAEAERIRVEAAKAKALASASQSAEDKKKMEELEARLKVAEEERKRIEAEAAKRIEEEKKRLAMEAQKAREDEAKRQQMIAAAQAAAKRAEDERRRSEEAARIEAANKAALMAKVEADRKKQEEAEARRKAEEKAKADAARAAAEQAARRFSPDKKVWYNSLGMKFVPVGKVHFAATETRFADFEAFVQATRHDAGKGWSSPGFTQEASHPVVNVNWKDAQAFCKWLTETDQKQGLIGNRVYRLPTDAEWSQAVGLPAEQGGTPAEKDGRLKGVYPWGAEWPPKVGAGNYPNSLTYDRFEKTAPAGSFRPNALGLFDLGGNVWEWCEDWSDSSQKTRVLRGGSWFMNLPASLFSSYRRHMPPDERSNDVGFRVVLAEP